MSSILGECQGIVVFNGEKYWTFYDKNAKTFHYAPVLTKEQEAKIELSFKINNDNSWVNINSEAAPQFLY